MTRRAEILCADALATWIDVLGSDNVLSDPECRRSWGRRTFSPAVEVAAVLRPADRYQVSRVLGCASEHRIPVHPVSRGANWGMGSRAPTVDGAVILDLSRMTAIEDFDAEHGLVRVEPGVTFGALADFLAARDCDFFIPEIGGSPDASVLANALDRGDGAMGNRWGSIGDLSVVLADGQVVETGFRAIDAHRLAGMDSNPVGPILDGLFSQSNLGVVTSAAVRLEPMPRNLGVFSARVETLAALPDLLAGLRAAQRAGAVRDRSATIWNGVKFLARENPRSAYTDAEIRQAATETWMLSGYLTAEHPQVLMPRCQWIVDAFADHDVTAEVGIVRTDGAWEPGCEGLLGQPSPRNLRTAYWSSQEIPAFERMDPDADSVGLIWLCLAFPFDGWAVASYVKAAAARLRQSGIDLNIGIEASSHRCLLTYISLSFDRNRPDADAEALRCYRDLVEGAERSGYAAYRLANGLPPTDRQNDTALTRYIADIRSLGDPAGILSPGRAGIG